jgi:hypothetical protein
VAERVGQSAGTFRSIGGALGLAEKQQDLHLARDCLYSASPTRQEAIFFGGSDWEIRLLTLAEVYLIGWSMAANSASSITIIDADVGPLPEFSGLDARPRVLLLSSRNLLHDSTPGAHVNLRGEPP